MAMTRCKANLHFYDTEKHGTCPYCEEMTGNGRPVVQVEAVHSDIGDTCTAPTITMDPQKIKIPAERDSSADCQSAAELPQEEMPASEPDQQFVQTVLAIGGITPEIREEPALAASPYEQFVQVEPVAESATLDPDQKTVMLFKESKAFNPVVGWLVSVEGPERGRDYRIKSGMNEIAREEDPEVDIVIKGDSTISRRHHAEIQYDPEDNVFYLIKLKNEAVKVNDVTVKRPTRLSPYDVLQFGTSRLVFVPLCSEKFHWTAGS
jgi:hypothetical protein